MARRTNSDTVGLQVGQQFEYLFDFGDSSWHEIKVEQVAPVIPGCRYLEIVEKHSRSPAQYGQTKP